MNRQIESGQNAMLTISLTSVVHQLDQVEFIYEDFIQHTFSHQTLSPAYATA